MKRNLKIIRTAITKDIVTFNPQRYDSITNAEMIRLCSGRLYSTIPNEDFSSYVLKGEIADGEPIQVDQLGKVWRIVINRNAKWDDGTPITSEDIIHTFKSMFDPILQNPKSSNLISSHITILNAKEYFNQRNKQEIVKWDDVGVKKIDEFTVELETVESHDSIEVMMHFVNAASSIVRKETHSLYTNNGNTDYGNDVLKFSSSGPYILREWVKGKKIRFIKNPYYIYEEHIKLDEFHVIIEPDEKKCIEYYNYDLIDYIEISKSNLCMIDEDEQVIVAPHKIINGISINTSNPNQAILKNKKFRNALYYGINRLELANILGEVPANYYLSTARIIDRKNGKSYRSTKKAQELVEENHSYNKVFAIQQFEEALRETSVNKVSITLLCPNEANSKVIADYLKASFEEIFSGRLALKIEIVDFLDMRKKMKMWEEDSGSYELGFCGWGGSTLAPWNALKYFTSNYPQKNEPFSNADFDELFYRASYGDQRFESNERLDITCAMEKILMDEKPYIPVTEKTVYYIKKQYVKLSFDHYIPVIGFGFKYCDIED
ncbi:MAG: ABC transporter substrate-binding protein [Maledivibacter sp.]|jgi:oligopeptide transport system substrate-binding protein|nr:ABC transporter substrate-binding protein [Maledivibacter sp.]